MKSLIFAFSFLSSVCFASINEPFTGLYDMAISKGTGVERIKFVLGGNGEELQGTTDPNPIRHMFRANIVSLYRCYSANYGSETQTTGQLMVHYKISSKGVTALSISSTDMTSPAFTDCVQSAWNNLKPEKLPPDGTTIAVTMPIRAQLRN